MRLEAALLIVTLGAAPAAAKVVSADDRAMVIESEAVVAAAPAKVWATLVQPSRWWSDKHSWSGDAANFSLDPRAGGCFCERLAGGGSVEHMRVVFVDAPKLLRLVGGLGPLQGEAASGPLTWTLKPDGAGTKLTLRYAVAVGSGMPPARMAPLVDAMLTEQVARLKAAAEL